MKIKISKSQWEEMGRIAKWIAPRGVMFENIIAEVKEHHRILNYRYSEWQKTGSKPGSREAFMVADEKKLLDQAILKVNNYIDDPDLKNAASVLRNTDFQDKDVVNNAFIQWAVIVKRNRQTHDLSPEMEKRPSLMENSTGSPTEISP